MAFLTTLLCNAGLLALNNKNKLNNLSLITAPQEVA